LRPPAGFLRRLGLRIDGGKVLLPDIIHGAVHRTHREVRKVQQQILIERRLLRQVKPERDLVVRESERHAVMIGGDQFVWLLGQDGECGALVALVFRLLPDAREHERLAVPAGEIIRLLAPFIPPFIEAVGGNDTAFLRCVLNCPLRIPSVRAFSSGGRGFPFGPLR